MSVTERSVETVERDTESAPPMLHRYPGDPRYRLSRMSPPQPGDIAYCGHVKTTPGEPHLRDLPYDCIVCAELERAR